MPAAIVPSPPFTNKPTGSRPLAEVLAELRAIPRDLIFLDDNIMTCREYARDLFRSLVPHRKRWVGQCSIEIADDPEMLRLAHDAGCRGLFIGIETVSQENLADMGKQFNAVAATRERLRKIRRQGIGVVAGMIVGLTRTTSGFSNAVCGSCSRRESTRSSSTS